MTVEFRFAKFSEYQRISQFLDTYWAKDHAYVRLARSSSTGPSGGRICGIMKDTALS